MKSNLEYYYDRAYSPQKDIITFFQNTFRQLIELNATTIIQSFATMEKLSGYGYTTDEMQKLLTGIDTFKKFGKYWQSDKGTVKFASHQAVYLNPSARVETTRLPIRAISLGKHQIVQDYGRPRSEREHNLIPLPARHLVTAPITISNWGKINSPKLEGTLLQSASHYVARYGSTNDFILYFLAKAHIELDDESQDIVREAQASIDTTSALHYGTQGRQISSSKKPGSDGKGTPDDF